MMFFLGLRMIGLTVPRFGLAKAVPVLDKPRPGKGFLINIGVLLGGGTGRIY
jgi:hypothetical protein